MNAGFTEQGEERGSVSLLAVQLDQPTQHVARLQPATFTPNDELRDINAAAADLGAMNPPLFFANAIRKLALS